MKTFLILVIAFAVASAATTTRRKRSTYEANLNDYVDKVISNLQAFITDNDFNSISIPNITQSFSVKPVWITYSGRLSLWDGVLSNLASVRRYGDVIVTYGDKTVSISANLGIDRIDVDYTYQAKLLGITASGTADGTASNIDTTTSLSANLETYTASLGAFTVNTVGWIGATLHGNTVIDWLATAVLNIVIGIIKDDVTTELEGTVTSAITNSLDEINAAIAAILES